MRKIRGSCEICWHADRHAIEQQIVNGRPPSQIAEQWGFTYVRARDGAIMPQHKTVTTHRDKCMAEDFSIASGLNRVQVGKAINARLAYLDECVDSVLLRQMAGEIVRAGEDQVPLLNADGTYVRRWNERMILLAVREARENLNALHRYAAGVPEPDNDALEQARQAVETPSVRALLQAAEEALARQHAELEDQRRANAQPWEK